MKKKKTGAYGTESLTKLLIYFIDGNDRTFRSYFHYDRKSKQAGIDKLKRYVLQENILPWVFHAEIYENTTKGSSIEIVVDGRNQSGDVQKKYTDIRMKLGKTTLIEGEEFRVYGDFQKK